MTGGPRLIKDQKIHIWLWLACNARSQPYQPTSTTIIAAEITRYGNLLWFIGSSAL